tara:strand:+ start:1580 stop:2239 length:660 start_codon:yes stop_codon:yes gene_type:complete
MIKNIIFDFDGVLVDSEILVAKAFSKYLLKKNINLSEKEFSIFAGKKTVQVIKELSQKFNIKKEEEFFDDIMKISHDIYDNELTPVVGAGNFLKNANLNYFIGSNSVKERIISGLKKVNFEIFFSEEKIYSFDMVNQPKPYPDIYLAALERNNLNKHETIIIEDSVVGVQAGVNAGVKVIGLTAGGHWHSERSTEELIEAGASLLIHDYSTLLNDIKKL